MLITLTSAAIDGTPADFMNYFKESVQISPDSEIALIQACYKYTTTPRESPVILINVDQFKIESICKEGGVQKAISAVPYGPPINGDLDGGFSYIVDKEMPLYHSLMNKSVENHNQLRVRLTDSVGAPLQNLEHPTIITLDIRPRTK